MKMYKCLNCGKEVEPERVKDKIRCPYCGYRILVKQATKVAKKVQAD
jgi:DNA-directed RNA polymerase subunit P